MSGVTDRNSFIQSQKKSFVLRQVVSISSAGHLFHRLLERSPFVFSIVSSHSCNSILTLEFVSWFSWVCIWCTKWVNKGTLFEKTLLWQLVVLFDYTHRCDVWLHLRWVEILQPNNRVVVENWLCKLAPCETLYSDSSLMSVFVGPVVLEYEN